MMFHRFGTLSHILASTELNFCWNKKSEDLSQDALIDKVTNMISFLLMNSLIYIFGCIISMLLRLLKIYKDYKVLMVTMIMTLEVVLIVLLDDELFIIWKKRDNGNVKLVHWMLHLEEDLRNLRLMRITLI